MAEGFANHYGKEVLSAEIAGLAPAGIVVDQTVRSMAEWNIDVSNHYSKGFDADRANRFDLIVNLSGYDLPNGIHVPVVEWDVQDPIGQSDAVYARVRDEIGKLVMKLIRDLRRERARAKT